MNGFDIFIIGIMVTIFIVAYFYQRYMREKRRSEWIPFARKLGLRFNHKDLYGIPQSEPHPLFNRGHSRRASNVMHGGFGGREIKCFDYRYTVGSGKNKRTYVMTCLLIEAPIPFKDLLIRPETFGDQIGEFFGADDIDFESDEFSRKFRVKCSDRRFAYDVLHTRAMKFLLGHKPLAIEARGRAVLLRYAKEQLLPIPHGVAALLETGGEFIELLPEYVLKERSRSTRE